jgi:xylan 1,4-beta-xylosidase
MKLPRTLSTASVDQLEGLTRAMPERNEVVAVPKSGVLKIDAPMWTNDILLRRIGR